MGYTLLMENVAQVSAYLAQNIRYIRVQKHFSQQQLADLAGIPRTTLTNLESGLGNPSLHNLIKLSAALGVGVEELLSRPRSGCVLIAAGDVPVQQRSQGQVQIYELLPDKIKGIGIERMEFSPQAMMAGHPHLPGSKEYMTVIQGEVAVYVAGEHHVVKAGAVLAFPGNQPHSYINTQVTPAVAISVVIPVPAST